MWSKLTRIGLIMIAIALLIGNLAVGIETACHGSNPDKCNGHCVNLQSDKQNCGDCGKVCNPDEVCHNGKCVSSNNNNRATCTDGKKNGKETDTDCGGPACQPCSDEKTCKRGTDCTSGVCAVGYCQAPSCVDQVKNGGETGVDCGGPCKPCAPRMPVSGIGNITVLPVQNAPGTPANLTLGPPSTTPTYKFVIDSCSIDNTRSLQQDTDYASLGVSVNNQVVIGAPKTKFIGNLVSNIYPGYPIHLEIGPIPIPDDPNIPVTIAYLIVNSGSAPSNVEYIMDGGTDALLLSYVPGSESMLAFADKNVRNMLTSYCDGTVAADKIVTNGQTIAQWIAKGPHSAQGEYHGTDSATGCGSNSHYWVNWHVEKVS